MQITQLVGKLGRNDARLFGRDQFLVFMGFFVVIISLVLSFGLPWLNNYLAENGVLNSETFITSLADIYPMLVAYMVIYTCGGVLVGTIFGFMLLDEKDDNTLKAMLVTPVSLDQYVLYRVGLPAALALFIILVVFLVVNQALVPLWQLLLIAAAGSLTAPIVSLFYAVFAANKVQGFAYSKFVSIFGWVIMLGWFVAEPFQWLFGLFPPFWVSKAYWLALEGNSLWWLALVISVILQLGLIRWLVARFNQVAYR